MGYTFGILAWLGVRLCVFVFLRFFLSAPFSLCFYLLLLRCINSLIAWLVYMGAIRSIRSIRAVILGPWLDRSGDMINGSSKPWLHARRRGVITSQSRYIAPLAF